jgi:uncharacterized membrane protein YfcA
MKEILYIVLGLTAGAFSGLFGIGGATILIPGLVLLAGLSQHEAQGTSLAILLLPLGILGVMKYYYNGHVHLYITAFIAIGFIIGVLLGANVAESLSSAVLKKGFGVFLMVVAVYMIFQK